MVPYRCYIMDVGHIVGVEDLDAISDDDAIELGKTIRYAQSDKCTGVEVWCGDRLIHREADKTKLA